MRLLTLLLLGAVALNPGARLRADLVNGIAVIVNDAVITYQDVKFFVTPAVELLMREHRTQPELLRQKIAATERDGTEQLVERQLILHSFKTAGYSLPESYIDEIIEERIRERFGDRRTLAQTLQAQGTTFETFRQQVREQFIIEQMQIVNVSSSLIISPHKIETYYRENRDGFKLGDQAKLRMIVLNRPRGEGGDGVRQRAEEILSKIKEGASFAEMASVYSEGSQRAQGGDWDWVERTVLRQELADVAFSLNPGELSGVIETPEACYLMLVEDRRASHIKPLSEVREEIEKTLLIKERARLRAKWIERLKSKSFVRYF